MIVNFFNNKKRINIRKHKGIKTNENNKNKFPVLGVMSNILGGIIIMKVIADILWIISFICWIYFFIKAINDSEYILYMWLATAFMWIFNILVKIS